MFKIKGNKEKRSHKGATGMSNHNGRKVVAVIIISMLIILLVAAGAYLALEDLVGGMDIQSFFEDSQAQQNEEIAASQQQAFDGYAFLEDNEKQAYARVVGMLTDFETEVKVSGVNTKKSSGFWRPSIMTIRKYFGPGSFPIILMRAIRRSAR